MQDKVITFIEQHTLLAKSGTLVVAFSGGADSLCLLHLLYTLCGPQKQYPTVRLHVAHLNHQLRGAASTQEAEAIAHLAAAWDIPYTIGTADVPALALRERRSLEDAGRIARYRFLREVAHGQPIAVAHHQDDQVETLLLHWIRGGGLASMVGLRPRQHDILRPLLCVTHAETLAYCKQHGLTPLEDASNSDTRFYRNRIRHDLLPLIESMNADFRATLLRNAEVMYVDVAWIEEQVDAAWQQAVLTADTAHVRLSLPHLHALPHSIQRHLSRRVTGGLSTGQSPLELRHHVLLEQLMQREVTPVAVSLDLPNGLVVTKVNETLLFQHQDNRKYAGRPQGSSLHVKKHEGVGETLAVSPHSLPIPGRVMLPNQWLAIAELLTEEQTHAIRELLQQGKWSSVWHCLPPTSHKVYLDAAYVGLSLHIRNRRSGDTMRPLGMQGQKKVQNILIDKHIPRTQRAQLPFFFNEEGHPVWLGGVCVDDRARLTTHTQHIVCLQLTNS